MVDSDKEGKWHIKLILRGKKCLIVNGFNKSKITNKNSRDYLATEKMT